MNVWTVIRLRGVYPITVSLNQTYEGAYAAMLADMEELGWSLEGTDVDEDGHLRYYCDSGDTEYWIFETEVGP